MLVGWKPTLRMSGKFQIEVLKPSDEAEVRAFLVKAIVRPGAEASMPDGWLAWMARGAEAAGVPDIPVGWKLMAEGGIGGVHLVVPFRTAAAGGEAISIQSAGYYVDPRWHGPASGALFLALMKYRARFHCSVGTANAASAKVWQAFKAEESAGSGEEHCVMQLSAGLVEEALVRKAAWMKRFLPGWAAEVRRSLPDRLAVLRQRLGATMTACGAEAAGPCAALNFQGAGAIPTENLLRWKLSAPERRSELLALVIAGQPCAVFLTAGPRGHRGQTAALSVSLIWGPAWESGPAVVSGALQRAARGLFPLVTFGFSPLPASMTHGLRRWKLDAPRRWLVRSAAQPPVLPGWNGLDAL